MTDRIAEIEQLRVQLAGCALAALGSVVNPALPGDYGWSPAYQDVLNLQRKYEELLTQLREREEALEKAKDALKKHKMGEVLKCKYCGFLTVSLEDKAQCPSGCPGHFSVIATVSIPESEALTHPVMRAGEET